VTLKSFAAVLAMVCLLVSGGSGDGEQSCLSYPFLCAGELNFPSLKSKYRIWVKFKY
jgi:hypothetical protein